MTDDTLENKWTPRPAYAPAIAATPRTRRTPEDNATPTPQYVENGVYRYESTLILYENGHWLMFGWDVPMRAIPGGGGDTMIDSTKIGDLVMVLD